MAPVAVHIKHAGKTHDITIDTDRPPIAFKENIYQKTGVPIDRMKVMVKGGILKDDANWAKIAPKEGQTFMVIGAAGELPKAPSNPVIFLEDLDDTELARALAYPVGLKNLGNTCYMNATVQAMRAIPELQTVLASSQPTLPLARSLRDLYDSMSKTTEGINPQAFLQDLRRAVPQFAEMSRSESATLFGGGYAQQDAEECWSQITNNLQVLPGLPGPSGSASHATFVGQYMTAVMRRELKCDEAPEEPVDVSTQKVLKVDCNISIKTNFMQPGILAALDEKIEKISPSLGRPAIYSQRMRLERLPTYLTVHMVRFAWRRDINKKAKIMRQVKFPIEFDALDLTTDELRAKLSPVSSKLKLIEKNRAERRKVRKRTKAAKAVVPTDREGDVDMAEAPPVALEEAGELQPEEVYIAKEKAELAELVDADVKQDIGASQTGLYDLVAIITHKGPDADGGHYIGFVKRSVFHPVGPQSAPAPDSSSIAPAGLEEDDEDWYKFDDEKVTVFPSEKIQTLCGGGEDASAYVLLYKSKSID